MNKSGDLVYIDSEIGKLQKVIVHSPGKEIEAMTPATAEKVLYNDIIPHSIVAEEHREFRKLLELVTTVYDITDLLTDVIKDRKVKQKLIGYIFFNSVENRGEELLDLPDNEFLTALICGLKSGKNNLTSFLSDREFDLNPLPNLYFTRDSAMVYENSIITGAMANDVRSLESLLSKIVFEYHPELKNSGFLFDGALERSSELIIEGGDFLVLSKDVLLIGISGRTSSNAIDAIASRISYGRDKLIHVFAFLLPKERAAIHLDMIFTLIDKDKALVYKPYIIGEDQIPVIRMDIYPDGKNKISRIPDIFAGLKDINITLEPILSGGGGPLFQQREQWLSGNNFLAFAPGKIIGYDSNRKTLDALDKGGFSVKYASDFLSGKDKIEDYKKLAIGIRGIELSRGGGGIRCMTLPVKREPLGGM